MAVRESWGKGVRGTIPKSKLRPCHERADGRARPRRRSRRRRRSRWAG